MILNLVLKMSCIETYICTITILLCKILKLYKMILSTEMNPLFFFHVHFFIFESISTLLCSQVIGLERALIVFVPSGRSDNDLGLQAEKDQFQELRNLSLRSCLQRYNEDDRRALWYMASRCLSDLVLLLP